MKLEVSDIAELKPVIAEVVAEVLAQMRNEEIRDGFTEPEAAARLGLKPHVLRDVRLAGKISARRMGKKWIYSSAGLRAWLEAGEPNGDGAHHEVGE